MWLIAPSSLWMRLAAMCRECRECSLPDLHISLQNPLKCVGDAVAIQPI